MSKTTNSESHPSYVEMVCNAIQKLSISKTGGVSKEAISNYMQDNYNGLASGSRFTTSIDKALKKGIGSGILEYQKYNTKKYKLSSNSITISKSTKKTKPKSKRKVQINKGVKTITLSRRSNRPYIEWIGFHLATMSAERIVCDEWRTPRVSIEELKHEFSTRSFLVHKITPLYYTSTFSPHKQYLLVLFSDSVKNYDIEQDEYIELARYPFNCPRKIKVALNRNDNKLYMFVLHYKWDRETRKEYDINYNLWCLDLNTANWTKCNFNQWLLLRECKMLCSENDIHIFYQFASGIHHEKLSLEDMHFSVASNLKIKHFPSQVIERNVNAAKIVYFKNRNEMILFGTPEVPENVGQVCVDEKDNMWICNLNDDGCKWNVFKGVELPLDGGFFNVLSVLDHFVLLFHLRYEEMDIWCLDLLNKQWYLVKKNLPEYVEYYLDGLIATDNEYIYYMDKRDHHFRFSFLNIVPNELRKNHVELCKRLVHGFVRQRGENEFVLSSNVPTMLKNMILFYFKSI